MARTTHYAAAADQQFDEVLLFGFGCKWIIWTAVSYRVRSMKTYTCFEVSNGFHFHTSLFQIAIQIASAVRVFDCLAHGVSVGILCIRLYAGIIVWEIKERFNNIIQSYSEVKQLGGKLTFFGSPNYKA